MGENSARRFPRKSFIAFYVRRLPIRLSKSFPKSELDLKNLHNQKRSNYFKTEKMSGR